MMSFIQRVAVSGLAFGVVVGLSTSAFAQANSLFGNSGATGGGTTANRGSAVAGGVGGGTGGGGGTAGTSGNAFGTGLESTTLGSLSSTAGNGTFVGQGNRTSAFVGNTNASQQTSRAMGNVQGVRGGNRNVQPGANGQTQLKIRPIHRVAFTYSPRTIVKLNTSLKTQFVQLASRNPRFQGLTLALNSNREVVLRGTVKDAATRKLAAAMARLEPGVRTVKNEIVVMPVK